DASVSVIDVASQQIIATVPVGNRPWGLAVTPDDSHVYVANGRSNSVSVIHAETRQITATIPVGDAPWGVVIH
ncbi:MAG: hypothetical protein IV084_06740, partial [Rugosibacter sp.]|nr:hypothetical protein [Rugosibacter sp.]